MDYRKTFDTIPEQFDKWRPRYCKELFDTVIRQAAEPFLQTGCNYISIELGENFVEFNKRKFGSNGNFHIINGDFETYDFGDRTANIPLSDELRKVFEEHFYVDPSYKCNLEYENAVKYGFTDMSYQDWRETRVYTADEYVEYLAATQIGHITLREPYKTPYYNGVRQAVLRHGDKMILNNTIALYLTRKPTEEKL